MRGQRRALAMMMPFSMLKLSLGNPAMSQSRTRSGSPRTVDKEYLGLWATPCQQIWKQRTSLLA